MEENIPSGVMNQQDLAGITKIISAYESIITDLQIYYLAKKFNENGELVNDPTRRPVLNEAQSSLFFTKLHSAISEPVRFSQHEHEQARQLMLHNLSSLRFSLHCTGLNTDIVDSLVEIYRTLATATLNGSIDGFTLHQITEHMNISEFRATGQDKKNGFKLPNLFRRGKGEDVSD